MSSSRLNSSSCIRCIRCKKSNFSKANLTNTNFHSVIDFTEVIIDSQTTIEDTEE